MVAVAVLQGGSTWQYVTSCSIIADVSVKDESNLPVLQVRSVRFGLLRAVQEALSI